jgi:hypothetical protein
MCARVTQAAVSSGLGTQQGTQQCALLYVALIFACHAVPDMVVPEQFVEEEGQSPAGEAVKERCVLRS